MDFNLSEDQVAFQDMARKFALEEMLPHAEKWDSEKIFPRDVLVKAAELGFAAIYVDPDHGTIGLCLSVNSGLHFHS